MSMFKRMLASAGIGAAKVDLVLDTDTVTAGDTIGGVVRIEGGRVEQQVDDVYAYVMTRYLKPSGGSVVEADAALTKILLAEGFTVEAERVYEFPVSFRLPLDTPVTLDRIPVWIQTGLDIKEAIDPKDQDYLQVKPHPYAAAVLEAASRLGLLLRKVSNEYDSSCNNALGVAFVQQFEFVPTSAFQGELDELELVFRLDEDGASLLLQIDRKARGLAGWLAEVAGADPDRDRFILLRIGREELDLGADRIAERLEATIRRHL
ncbi:sporulation protein [Cohnella fermenti]|uniref:Sporulation protein n=1 Tax=Cohnella fermenti TaxID=2565925 RepID=A0A4S4BHV3_9BACL|nr:sporulation protein [Cohnella fermenti]THF74133.1 sporulation protein [Cohnella fermenti]